MYTVILCDNCKTKPIARGIKNIRCLSCNQEATVNVAYTANICAPCSVRKSRCAYCGDVIHYGKVIPFSPQDAAGQHVNMIPDAMIEAINELLAKNFSLRNKHCNILQRDILDAYVIKMGATIETSQEVRDEAIKNKWLDIESLYENYGWKVTYDKPTYDETYEAYFKFTKV